MTEEIEELTNWLILMTYGTGLSICLKQFGDRTRYRWEILSEGRADWLGTLWFGSTEILTLAQLGRSEKIGFLGDALNRSFGRRDDA